jgi:hypothetical protein
MSRNNQVAILSPAYPPAINGLGDYAFRLGEALKGKGTAVAYVALEANEAPFCPREGDFYTIRKDVESLPELLRETGIRCLYINYSNYGYQEKGVPFWLVKAVDRARKEFPGLKVITFFHELYATSKPWQSAFWLEPFQRGIFRRMYDLSDTCFCSNDRVLDIIRRETPDRGKKTRNIGIFSNIPEPVALQHWDMRKHTAIVFGTTGRKTAIYNNLETLNAFIAQSGITRISDIGRGTIPVNEKQLDCELVRHGEQSAAEVSALMQECGYGLIDYPASLLGKSGIFAAYAAHGLAVVNFTADPTSPGDGLVSGRHFSPAPGIGKAGQVIGEQAHSWYQPRDLEHHATGVFEAIST